MGIIRPGGCVSQRVRGMNFLKGGSRGHEISDEVSCFAAFLWIYDGGVVLLPVEVLIGIRQ